MYHWYLLFKHSPPRKAPADAPSEYAHFSAGHGPNPPDSLPEEMRRKFFWLGALEFMPTPLAFVFGGFLESHWAYGWTLFAGMVLTVVACWASRNKVPPTVIHVATPNTQKEEATTQ